MCVVLHNGFPASVEDDPLQELGGAACCPDAGLIIATKDDKSCPKLQSVTVFLGLGKKICGTSCLSRLWTPVLPVRQPFAAVVLSLFGQQSLRSCLW
jgi:hypothetical protein